MSKDANKEKKHFAKDFKAELKRVIWPTPKQLANSTVAVITIVLITAIIVFILDFTFERGSEFTTGKLKTFVESKNAVENTVTVENVDDSENVETIDAENSISE